MKRRNPDYWQQIRARGVCVLCRQAMPDSDPRLAHNECERLRRTGVRNREIRQRAKNPPKSRAG